MTLYRGLPYDLPLGLELYEPYYASGVTIAQVPEDRRDHLHRPQAALQGRRRGPRQRARAGPAPVSARNRELLALVPASLLLTAGFAAIFIQQSDVVSDVSLTYGLWFLGLCFAGHLFLRFTLPYADPYMFPLVAVLACFGLVVIYRIDEELAREQAQWFVVGLALFAATILLLRDLRVLERYRYTIAAAGLFLLFLPRVPGIGAQVNGAYLGVDLGPIAFQPAEFGKIAIIIFLAAYLRDTRQVLVQGATRVAGVTIPPLKHFGPLLVVWGAAMLMLVFIRDLGSSLMYFGGFLALLYVATNASVGSRRATNENACAVSRSSHCVSSTTHRSGCALASCDNRLRTARPTSSRSGAAPLARPNVTRSASRCGSGSCDNSNEPRRAELLQRRVRKLVFCFVADGAQHLKIARARDHVLQEARSCQCPARRGRLLLCRDHDAHRRATHRAPRARIARPTSAARGFAFARPTRSTHRYRIPTRGNGLSRKRGRALHALSGGRRIVIWETDQSRVHPTVTTRGAGRRTARSLPSCGTGGRGALRALRTSRACWPPPQGRREAKTMPPYHSEYGREHVAEAEFAKRFRSDWSSGSGS